MRVLVCGGRDYNDIDRVKAELDAVHSEIGPITTIIEGGATGADACAAAWVTLRQVGHEEFKVSKEEWRRIGPAAGPLRNQRMIDEGKPDLVMAFPGNRGTADMVRRAKAAGIKVIDYAPLRDV